MDHSLLNQNQMQLYGVRVCGKAFDDERPYWIEVDNLFVSFQSEGNVIKSPTGPRFLPVSTTPSLDATLNFFPAIATSDKETSVWY